MPSTTLVRGPLQFLAAPDVEDPQERRSLRILFGIARPLLVGLVAMAVLFPLLEVSPPRVALLASLVSLVACLPVLVSMGLGHRGRAGAGSSLLMTAGFASAATAFFLFGGLTGPLGGVLILTVMCAGVLSGVRAAVIMGAAAVVVASAQLALELAGLSFAIPAAISATGAYVTTIVFLCVGAGVLGLYIHEMEQAAAAVRSSNQRALASEQRLANLVRHSPDGIAVVGPDMRLESVNEAVEQLSGYGAHELVGKRLDELPGVPSEDIALRLRDGFQRGLTGRHNLAQMALKSRDGRPYEVEFHHRQLARPDGTTALQVVMRDVTARAEAERTRQRMEDELRAARRMESMGRLAGGVAHDFRNLLTPVVMNTSELLERATGEDRRLLQEIRDAAERAGRVTGQLLTFARKEKQELKALDLAEVTSTLLPLLRRLARADVEVTLAPSPGCGVRADRSQLEQVLVNLVANARDAMPHGGDVALRVERVTLDAAQAARVPGAQAAPYVMLEVKDTGEGMTPDVMEHIWEPFFSTKPRDQGTGLGLATVLGIATQSGGFAAVDSTPGAGSTFRVYLPAVATPAPTPWHDPPTTGELAAARGKVALVADDEPLVRAVLVRVLRRAGYQVFEATNGAEALEVAMSAKAPLDLLVSDLVMPGMGGRELVPEVRRLFPGLRVLLVSGYSEDTAALGTLGEHVQFLAKPFSPASLLATVEDLMKA